jgi:RNA polymerase sigma-70 factor (ECF subfamily)
VDGDDPTAALARLFDEHAVRLAGALSAAGYPDAADAVQEAFAQAVVHWRKVGRYDDPLLWIRRVAVNRARNRRRGRHRQRALAERIAAQPAASVDGLPEHRDNMTEAVRGLPQQQRVAVALFYFADLSVAEVAAAMELSEGAVKYHLHAARAALAQKLEVADDSV